MRHRGLVTLLVALNIVVWSALFAFEAFVPTSVSASSTIAVHGTAGSR